MQFGRQLRQCQIGLRPHPTNHLLLCLGADPWLTARLVRHTLCLTCAISLSRDLLRPAQAHDKPLRQFFQRSISGVVGRQKFPAQVIPIRFTHIGFIAEYRQIKSTLLRETL